MPSKTIKLVLVMVVMLKWCCSNTAC